MSGPARKRWSNSSAESLNLHHASSGIVSLRQGNPGCIHLLNWVACAKWKAGAYTTYETLANILSVMFPASAGVPESRAAWNFFSC
jgi:hypothetical protein